MTTELLTYGKTEQPAPAVRSGLYKNQKNPSRKKTDTASTNGFFEGTAAFLKMHALEIDGWARKMSTTLAHLDHAYKQLANVETQLKTQRERIKTLECLATTDDLTGLKNRRGFYEGFVRELECCDRGISKGGLLIMIDLDDFKSVNDSYGHAAGDAVLKLVAKTLSNEVRKMDIAARLGGDEFVLLMTNTSAAATRAQLIGWHLNNLSLAWNGNIIPVRASVGTKAFNAGDKVESILHAADGTLYATKFERREIEADTRQGGSNSASPLT